MNAKRTKAATTELDFATLSQLRGDGDGPLDHPCPLCGPERIAELNQQRKVLRTWELTPGVITFYCARCEARGSAQANAAQMLQRPRKLKPTRPPSDDKDKLIISNGCGHKRSRRCQRRRSAISVGVTSHSIMYRPVPCDCCGIAHGDAKHNLASWRVIPMP